MDLATLKGLLGLYNDQYHDLSAKLVENNAHRQALMKEIAVKEREEEEKFRKTVVALAHTILKERDDAKNRQKEYEYQLEQRRKRIAWKASKNLFWRAQKEERKKKNYEAHEKLEKLGCVPDNFSDSYEMLRRVQRARDSDHKLAILYSYTTLQRKGHKLDDIRHMWEVNDYIMRFGHFDRESFCKMVDILKDNRYTTCSEDDGDLFLDCAEEDFDKFKFYFMHFESRGLVYIEGFDV